MKTIEEIWGNGKDIVIKYAGGGQIWWSASSWGDIPWSPHPEKQLIKRGYRLIDKEILNGKA